jgi:hypothetical protein
VKVYNKETQQFIDVSSKSRQEVDQWMEML